MEDKGGKGKEGWKADRRKQIIKRKKTGREQKNNAKASKRLWTIQASQRHVLGDNGTRHSPKVSGIDDSSIVT